MNIILTGSTGGIGSAIKEKLLSNGINVICTNRANCDLSQDVKMDYANIHGLIYCAGINNPSPYQDISEEDMIKIMKVNTLSFIKMCQQIKFNHGANIIAVGSLYATETRSGRLSYSMSKHALYGAIKTMAIEMAPNRIKVNMVSPGFVLTKLTEKNNTKERIKYLEDNIPLGMTNPSDIADVCYFLCSNNSITGQNIIVDNGYSLLGI